tara:strand:- start:518 stop:1597 length:1080 start_codon:yes stop_codon:yes gene_type:complete
MKGSIYISILIAIVVAAWILSGQLEKEKPSNKNQQTNTGENTQKEKKVFLVKAEDFLATPRISEIVLRGRTEASRRVKVKAETSGKVRKIIAKEGQTVKSGNVLFKIDMKDRKSRLREAIALVEQRQLEYDVASKLKKQGHRSATKLAAAATSLESAIARQKNIDLDIANTTIKAPFAGYVEKMYVELGSVVDKSTIVAEIVDKDPFLVVGQISESEVAKISIGDRARATLLDGTKFTGKIRYISLAADPKTRTFKVEIQIPNTNNKLREGLTAEIYIKTSESIAHFLSPAVLTLNDSGVLGVRTISKNKIVKFVPVNILDDTSDGIWVSGLPANIKIITVGQEFVTDGQTVRVSQEGT